MHKSKHAQFTLLTPDHCR